MYSLFIDSESYFLADQRAMGLSMRTERASIDDVKARLTAGLSKKRDTSTRPSDDFDDRVMAAKEREEKEKQEKKDKKKEAKRLKKEEEEKQKGEENAGEEDVFAMMGLPSGFGGSKK